MTSFSNSSGQLRFAEWKVLKLVSVCESRLIQGAFYYFFHMHRLILLLIFLFCIFYVSIEDIVL